MSDQSETDPMRYFASFNPETGIIQTCYDNRIHGMNIPSEAIEMTSEQFHGHINQAPRLKVDVDADPLAFVEDVREISLDVIKAQAKERAIRWFNELTGQLRKGYPSDEVASWPAKAVEARKVRDGLPAGPLISSEAAMTGETESDVADAIIAKAELFEEIIGKVTGLRRNILSSIDAADSETPVLDALAAGLSTAATETSSYGLNTPS